jgi:hypothetical protein
MATANFWKPEDRTPLLKKYQTALKYAGVSQFHKGRRPFQDVNLLVRLRNVLVHYTPASLASKDAQHKFEQNLKSKFPMNRMMDGAGNPYFPDKCLGYGCCEWAIKSSRNFADAFFAKIGVTPHYQMASFLK